MLPRLPDVGFIGLLDGEDDVSIDLVFELRVAAKAKEPHLKPSCSFGSMRAPKHQMGDIFVVEVAVWEVRTGGSVSPHFSLVLLQ